MRSQKIQALCFGVFLLPALTSRGASVVIDNFDTRQESYQVAAQAGQSIQSGWATASGCIGGNRTLYVSASADSWPALAQSVVDVGTLENGYAVFMRYGTTTAGFSTHTISWTAESAYNLLSLSEASSMDALTFQLDGFYGGQTGVSQPFTVQVGGVGNNATFSGIGNADTHLTTLTYLSSIGTPDLSGVTQISLSATIPFGANPQFMFDNLYAVGVTSVPEPSQWAMMGVTFVGVAGFVIRQRRAKAAAR